jgi:hypothetical protein
MSLFKSKGYRVSYPALGHGRLFPPLLGKTLWKRWKNKSTRFPDPGGTEGFAALPKKAMPV